MCAPPDAAERARALDIARSFIVQAPAGSGKTELLAQRYLKLLARVDRPEEVVALTFTRKAAGEMRARVLAALDRARGPEPDAGSYVHTTWALARDLLEHDARLAWRLESQPARLRIMTLDALCALLARQMPYLSGAGGALRITPKPNELYAEAARRLLGGIAQVPPQPAVERLLHLLDNRFDLAERLLAAMLGRRDHWLRLLAGAPRNGLTRARLEAALAHVLREQLGALRTCVPAALAPELADVAAGAADRLAAAGAESALIACRGLRELPGVEDIDAWRGLAELLLTGRDDWRRRANVKLGFPRSEPRDKCRWQALIAALSADEDLRARLADCRRLPAARYTDEQWSALAALGELLPLAAAELVLLFRERGEADYIAQSHAALQALGEEGAPTDLALALDDRVRHLLVDEFQDTSHTQYRLLERLTAGWQADDGRTLFLVGDPTQSIYRFREAEVGLFLTAREHGIGDVRLDLLQLVANFRSQRGLVEWVNRVFAPIFPAANERASGAVAYAPGAAWQTALPGEAVSVHASHDAGAEADKVVELVRAARRADSAQRIAILVRARSHLAAVAARLSAAGLPFQAQEIEPLSRRPEIADLMALTRALVHFADRTAWLAVLRAPWCGLSLADLHALAAPAADVTIWDCMQRPAAGLSADGAARLERLRRILAAQLGERGRHRLRDWVEHTWLALGGPATLDQAGELANADAYFELLATLRAFDVTALEGELENLYAAPDPAADDTLQLMTIHKAKGLEFDTVILPGLGRVPKTSERPLLHWLEIPRSDGEIELLLAPIGAPGETDALHAWIAGLVARRDALESRRVLYVAATRARSRLHLLGSVGPGREGTLASPRTGSFLHALWPELGHHFDALPVRRPTRAPVPAPRPAGIRRLVNGWQPPVAPAALAVPGLMQEPAVPEPPPYDWAGEPARRIGIVVHRALQRIAEEGLDAWPDERLAAAGPILAAGLRAQGLPGALVAAATQRALDALRCTLADERGQWILRHRPGARCEYPITGRHAGGLVNAVIDRSFVDEAGVRWIVDYKSSRHEGGGLEAFLDSELDRYAPKLALYVALMGRFDPRPVRAGLYFPLMAQWREWSPVPVSGAGSQA